MLCVGRGGEGDVCVSGVRQCNLKLNVGPLAKEGKDVPEACGAALQTCSFYIESLWRGVGGLRVVRVAHGRWA